MKKQALSFSSIDIRNINTKEDILSVIRFIIYVLQVNFHPDDPISGYINTNTKEPSFTEDYEITQGQAIVDKICELAEELREDIYELCMEVNPLMTKIVIEIENGIIIDVQSNNRHSEYVVVYCDKIENGEIDTPLVTQFPTLTLSGNFNMLAVGKTAEALKEIGY